jgi:hypothetical protein
MEDQVINIATLPRFVLDHTSFLLAMAATKGQHVGSR